MRKPKWHKQEQATSCVAACVRMVLTSFDEDWAESEVRDLLDRPKLGITLKATRERLAKNGAAVFLFTDWSLDDLRDLLRQNFHPIVGVERHILGYVAASHAVVITRIESKQVGLLDPLNGPREKHYNLDTFNMAWRLSGKEALVIKSPPIHLI